MDWRHLVVVVLALALVALLVAVLAVVLVAVSAVVLEAVQAAGAGLVEIAAESCFAQVMAVKAVTTRINQATSP